MKRHLIATLLALSLGAAACSTATGQDVGFETEAGAPPADCEACFDRVAVQDPYCADKWDAICETLVDGLCGGEVACGPVVDAADVSAPCAEGDEACMPLDPVCANSCVAMAAPMAEDCSPCAAQVIAMDPYCGSQQWDDACVEQARSVCVDLSCPF